MKYNIVRNDGEPTSASVYLDNGRMLVATKEHPHFDAILDQLYGVNNATDEEVEGLFDAAVSISRKFNRLTERVAINAGRIFLDGVEVDNALTKTIVTFHAAGEEDFLPLVNFMEKIETNPNQHSKENLFRWLQKHRFAIHPDGDFIAYKGINQDGKSSSAGEAWVNGEVITGRIPNKPGTIVEMPRDKVQHDPRVGCHTGLHAGNWRYASTFVSGGKMLRVKINPRDVVSVPTDSNDEKLRVCRYYVLDVVTQEDTSHLLVDEALKTMRLRASERQRTVVTKGEVGIASGGVKRPAKRAKRAVKKVAQKVTKAAGKKVVGKKLPSYFEDFNLNHFRELKFAQLRWLAKEWGVKLPARASQEAAAQALAKAASARRRDIKAKKLRKKDQVRSNSV